MHIRITKSINGYVTATMRRNDGRFLTGQGDDERAALQNLLDEHALTAPERRAITARIGFRSLSGFDNVAFVGGQPPIEDPVVVPVDVLEPKVKAKRPEPATVLAGHETVLPFEEI